LPRLAGVVAFLAPPIEGVGSASGDVPPDKRWRFLFDKSETFLDCFAGTKEDWD